MKKLNVYNNICIGPMGVIQRFGNSGVRSHCETKTRYVALTPRGRGHNSILASISYNDTHIWHNKPLSLSFVVPPLHWLWVLDLPRIWNLDLQLCVIFCQWILLVILSVVWRRDACHLRNRGIWPPEIAFLKESQ